MSKHGDSPPPTTDTRAPKVAGGSLFAGIGGLELGAHVAGLAVDWRWQVEQEPFCRRVLARHFPSTDRSVTDVCEAGAHNLEPVDVICGGFPCQDISLAGKGAGLAGERSGLWREMARVIAEVGPRVVVVENVTALVARGLDVVLADLADLGFDAEWCDLRASDVGAPHKRSRIFVVAWRVSDPVGERVRELQQRAAARRAAGEQGSRWDVTDGCGGAQLADTDSARPQRRPVAVERGEEGQQVSCARGEKVADAKRLGPQGQQQAGAEAWTTWRRPSWPPGPDDIGEWRQRPAFAQPSFRRDLDGVPAWVHRSRRQRLKALGNAVCPQQAAIAWRRAAELLTDITTDTRAQEAP